MESSCDGFIEHESSIVSLLKLGTACFLFFVRATLCSVPDVGRIFFLITCCAKWISDVKYFTSSSVYGFYSNTYLDFFTHSF